MDGAMCSTDNVSLRPESVVLNIDKWISACNELSNLSGELRVLQSECIRLGYGERDTDGNFVLKNNLIREESKND